MRRFAAYSRELRIIADRLLVDPGLLKEYETRINSALNGGPAASLRKSIPLRTRRGTGSFFTGDDLLSALRKHVDVTRQTVYDPACGTGNLLLLQSQSLTILPTVEETLSHWSDHLSGSDLHPEFIETAKARLILSLFQREPGLPAAPQLRTDDLFHKVVVSDGLNPERYKNASQILINPPFQKTAVSESCKWASGKVSAEAVFLEACVKYAPVGAKIIAILPDVLRSGSNYEKWRSVIKSNSSIDRIETYGEFDKFTDVSVFILSLTKTNLTNDSDGVWWESISTGSSVGDFFNVSVGTVVPFRNDEKGPSYRYVQPKGLPNWQVVRSGHETIRFSGRTVEPPFVVVRRNSRFEDKHRATATLITGEGPVAVENHLIVLEPIDNTVRSCRELLRLLQSEETTDWLNSRIRCRHLTVSAVKEIPWR